MRARGFTLLEVLVATVIMAIAVTGLLSNLTTSLNNASRLTDYDRVSTLARHKMDELLVTRQLPRVTPFAGEFDPGSTGGLRCGWRAQLTPFEAGPGAAPGARALERIELEVWWMHGSDRRSLRVDAYRIDTLQPPDMALLGGRRP
jgi:general secretion pathway protein I